jgi:DUF4097 and DUF4098 domain-containing protein YvlB
MKVWCFCALGLLALPVLAEDADIDKVNGSIRVAASERAGDLSTVNGSIRVAEKATVGKIETVNGSISLEDEVAASDIDNVNGAISLGERARVAGRIESVNGAITLQKGTDVSGDVENVNGKITLAAAHVAGGIRTSSGDIEIGADSRVDKGIHVAKPSGEWFRFGKSDVPRIVIGPGAVVKGTLRFEREVELYVSDKATIGPVEGAKAVKFSGAEPPS